MIRIISFFNRLYFHHLLLLIKMSDFRTFTR